MQTHVKIHDKFSIEFKIGFTTYKKEKDINDFKINTWVFLPNGLDINRHTYSEQQFYSDIKSNTRLITPVYSLHDILKEDKGPFPRLKKAIEKLLAEPSEKNEESYVYQIKMLLCILKSSFRNNKNRIYCIKDETEIIRLCEQYVSQIQEIVTKYRETRNYILQSSEFSTTNQDYIQFGDEFLGMIVEQQCFDVLKKYRKHSVYPKIKSLFFPLLKQEDENKTEMGYGVPEQEDEESKSFFLIRKSVLKKLMESDLYLQRKKKQDGAFARELYYSLGAGLAMVFATVISFFATQRFGNFTTSLFFILVLSYMMKDKIKEVTRFYFSTKLDKKYFDRKWILSIRNQEIGWIKEAFDFIPDKKIPQEILEIRNKTPMVKAENKVYDEKVILYRKRVSLSKTDLEKYKEYHLSGINEIVRFNLMSLVKKMDNPTQPIYLSDEERGYIVINGTREYALYFILECGTNGDNYYKKYRILFNRDGITSITELENEE